MTSFLDEACAAARRRAADAAQARPLEALEGLAAGKPMAPDFAAALDGPGTAVVAEVKRASPSRGRIAAIPHAAALAQSYAAGGAAAVSVLTEPDWFAGSLDDLAAVAAVVPVPVLRKDFVVDPYQVWEARALGAAAVLLIVAALPFEDLKGLLAACRRADVGTLVEVHETDEVGQAVDAHAAVGHGRLVIGVNARDLATLDVDPQRFEAVRGAVPDSALIVAESGVEGPEDVRMLAALGADAVLVGEHVAAASDPTGAIRALVEAGRP